MATTLSFGAADVNQIVGARLDPDWLITQDLKMASALKASKIQGISAAWYPTGLLYGRQIPGNHLRTVDEYTPLRSEILAQMPRLVYEFDTADVVKPYLYPAIVRAFRETGVQFIAMFSYDMVISAPTALSSQRS